MQITNVTIFCFFASYVCALVLELTQFLKISKVVRWASFALAGAGFLAQTIYLLERSHFSDLPPLLGSTHDWLLVSAWLAIIFYLGVKVWDQSLSIGLFVLPIVLLLIVASRFASDQPNPRITIAYWWTLIHASFWMLGILGVILALVMSMMYLIQHYRLRNKKAPIPALRLFSLERLNRLNWWLIVSSVPLLTLGMVTGLWMSYLRADSAEPVDLAQLDFIMFALVWISMTFLFGWLLVSRRATGRLVAWRTILACGFLIVTILAIEFLSADTIHGHGKSDGQGPQAQYQEVDSNLLRSEENS